MAGTYAIHIYIYIFHKPIIKTSCYEIQVQRMMLYTELSSESRTESVFFKW